MSHLRAALIISCLYVVSLSAQSPPKKDPGKGSQARIEKKTYDFKEAGKEMEYAQFVPTSYDKAKKSPLIVALHGLGSNPQQIMRYRGLTDLAEKHGFIVVAPMGYNSGGWYGNPPPFKAKKLEPENLFDLSEKDVMNVLAIAQKDFNVDPNRIYLMGHSMGGGGTWHLAIKFPDIWAGLAPIAPAIWRPAADVEKIKHIPVMLVQGAKDTLVRPEGARRWAEEMKKQSMNYEYIEEADGDHINVAFTSLPKIFEFFEKHKKGK